MSATQNSTEATPREPIPTPPNPSEFVPPPVDLVSPQLTVRAVLSGMILGGVLSMCNIYTGLTIGWGLNMSILSILLTYAFWSVLERTIGTRPWTMLENNAAQTATSSGAAVSSAGLVAPIPALVMLTGQELSWPALSLWVFSVCLVGIVLAVPIRRQMIIVDKLPFPSGIAAATMLREMHGRGAEAMARVGMLAMTAVASFSLKLLEEYQFVVAWIGRLFSSRSWEIAHIPIWPFAIKGFTPTSLTVSIEPSLLMVGVGGLIGFRACVSLLAGSLLAWLVVAPALIQSGHIRLISNEPLPALPAGVAERLEPEPRGFLRYNAERRRLEFKGRMTAEQRDAFLALSTDQRYRDAIHKLFAESEFDAQSANPADFVACASSADIRASVACPPPPSGFAFPPEARGILSHSKHNGGTLTLLGKLTGELRDAVLARVREHARQHPDDRDACSQLELRMDELAAKAAAPLPQAWLSIPESLRSRVTIDPERRLIRVVGELSAEDAAALAAPHQNDRDYANTVGALRGASSIQHAAPNFPDVVAWLLWPGVTLMVVSSLVSFSFSWASIGRSFAGLRGGRTAAERSTPGELSMRWLVSFAIVALVLSVILQVKLFEIPAWAAAAGVILSFLLAIVAARVAGETNNTPVGAMGKVTQLLFGVMVPQNPAPNLMAANVTGGAASQCADLMHDLKTGYMIGASPTKQFIAQTCGALAGSLIGSAAYLVMIPNPRDMLITAQYPAPAVVTWKAVAELFSVGLSAIPAGTKPAILIAAILGVLLPLAEKFLPQRARVWVPSAASLGLAFVIPGYNAISMFIGGAAAALLSVWTKNWAARFLVASCAGLVAGESLAGVGVALQNVIWR